MANHVGGPVGLNSHEFLLNGERAECDQKLSFEKQAPQTLLKAAVVLCSQSSLATKCV